jgi:hypothetical protein
LEHIGLILKSSFSQTTLALENNSFTQKPSINKDFLDEKRGVFFFFRSMSMAMQARFIELIEHKAMPRVFLHGNPHVENYLITENGGAVADFDRARIGAYAWDIVRFLSSVAIKKEVKNEEKADKNLLYQSVASSDYFLPNFVLEYFLEGYLRSFYNPNLHFKKIGIASDKADRKVWFSSTNEYLEANIKWARKMRKNPIDVKDKTMRAVLMGYLKSRHETKLLKEFQISEAGISEGTFGNKRYLVVLSPKKLSKYSDSIFLDLKTVYQDPDNAFYFNPFKHHGLRMIKASQIYAPNIELRMGYTTFQGQQYWGREIPSKGAKIKETLDELEQVDMVYSVATQLGRAHRKTLYKSKPKELIKHLENNYEKLVLIGHQLNAEIIEAHTLIKEKWQQLS